MRVGTHLRRLALGALAGALLLAGCAGLPEPDLVRTSYIGPTPPGGETRLGRGSVSALAFSPDASALAVGGAVGLYLYDVETLDTLWSIASAAPVTSAAFSPDGVLLAAGLDDGSVSLLSTADGSLLASLTPSRTSASRVDALAWSAEDVERGSLLAAGYGDGTLAVVNFKRAEGRLRYNILQNVERLAAGATALAYSPNGALLAAGDRSGAIVLWDAWSAQNLGRLDGHEAAVSSLDWSPDGTTLLSGGRDGRVITWDAIDAAPLHVMEEHESAVLAVTFAEDGRTFGSISESGTIITWQAPGPEPQRVFANVAGRPGIAAWSPGAAWLAEVTADGQLALWDLERIEVGQVPTEQFVGHTTSADRATAVAWSPAGDRLASGSGRRVLIWDPEQTEPLRTLEGHSGLVHTLAWSPDGGLLASGSGDRTVIVWDARTGAIEHTLSGHTGGVTGVAWSPDGARLASVGSVDDNVLLWDARSGEQVAALHGRQKGVWSVTFSPDGSALAVGTSEGDVLLWATDAATGAAPYETLRGHLDWVSSLAYSPDGTYLAAGSGDTLVLVWNLATGDRLAPLAGHHAPVRGLAFSPDGARLASVGLDKNVRLWRLAGAGVQAGPVLAGHSAGVDAVDWAPDGAALASGSDDGTVIVWDVAD